MQKWKCNICGHEWTSEEAPHECPACFAPESNLRQEAGE